MDNMKISIIVPVYNVEKYITQCIESIIAQTYENKEVLLINDGSTDKSELICKEYESKYPYIKLISKKNGGLSDARNVGIFYSTGDYILFLDSDDYWDCNFLHELVSMAEENNPDYIFFRHKCYYQKSNVVEEIFINCKREDVSGKDGNSCLKYILDKNNNYGWYACLCMISRSFILDNKLFFETGRNYEDALWTPKVFLNARKVDYYDKAIYVYRLERDGQITSSLSYKNLVDSIYVARHWHETLLNCNIDITLRNLILQNISTRFYVAIWFSGFINSCDKRRLIAYLRENNVLLQYCIGTKKKITKFLCYTVGFRITSLLFKYFLNFKKLVKINIKSKLQKYIHA